MIDFAAAAAELVAVLRAGNVSAALDMRDLNLPGVLVPMPDLSFRFGKDSADATWRLVAASPNIGRQAAMGVLAELVGAARAALGHLVVSGRPVDVLTGESAGPMPGYELTLTTRITESEGITP